MDLYRYEIRVADDSTVFIDETKHKDVMPMISGFFRVGMNYMEIFPYKNMGGVFQSRIFFGYEEMQQNDDIKSYCFVTPYKNVRMARKMLSAFAKENGMNIPSLEKAPVCSRQYIGSGSWNADLVSCAKRIDNAISE